MTGFLLPITPLSPQRLRRRPHHDAAPPEVAVIVPMYRESVETCRRSAAGMLRLDYPRERLSVVWVVPEGDPVSQHSAETGFAAISSQFSKDSQILRVPSMRPKGRALNEALARIRAHSVALFLDADVVPAPTQVNDAVALIDAGADIVEAFEFHELTNWVDRMIAAENAAHLGSMMFLERHLRTAFLQGSSLYVTADFLARAGGYIEDQAEECFVWSLYASRLRPQIGYLPTRSYGAPVRSLRAALRQRARWLRGQLSAARHLKDPDLSTANRLALALAVASILAQLATAPTLMLATRYTAARKVALGLVAMEALRIGRTAALPQWRGLGIRDGWLNLLGFELLQGIPGWQAVWELAQRSTTWHSVRRGRSV